jgi:large subunit ribosomal protein L19e
MGLVTVRRLAASILGVGESRVRIIDPKAAEDALTRDDVRQLIKDGYVTALQKKGVGHKAVTHKRGRGHRKGSYGNAKELWMRKVRAQRKCLASAKPRMEPSAYRKAYRMVKGNAFRDVAALKTFLKENKMLK